MAPPDRRRRLTLAAAAIAAAGLAASAAVWLRARAAERAVDPLGDPLNESKRYVRDLAMYGGTANVLATEMRQWIAARFEGVNLAYTIAALSLLAAAAVLFVGRSLPPRGPRAREVA